MKITNIDRPGELALGATRGTRSTTAAVSTGITLRDATTEANFVRDITVVGGTVTDGGDDTAVLSFALDGLTYSSITPATLTANTDNWDPVDAVTGAGIDEATVLRVSTNASRNLTGVVAGAGGVLRILVNVGSNDLVLIHDATSTAANRFYTPFSANLTLTPNSSAWLVYDTVSSRWRVVGSTVPEGSSGWTNYTPTWTATVNPAIGNGSVTGRFRYLSAKTLHVVIHVVMGSTTTYGTGRWELSLPPGVTTTGTVKQIIGCYCIDVSTITVRNGHGWMPATSSIVRPVTDIGGINGVNATIPFTWAQSDECLLEGIIEIS